MLIKVLVALLAAAAAGCGGGSEYAGLSEEDAKTLAVDALVQELGQTGADLRDDGDVIRVVDGDPGGFLTKGDEIRLQQLERASRSDQQAWQAVFAGPGRASVCVSVWAIDGQELSELFRC